MILVDTLIWVAHLRSGEPALVELLNAGRVLLHPFILGELVLGNPRQRRTLLASLHDLPVPAVATDSEMLPFIERNGLAGSGIGWVDAHLLASAGLTVDASIWTFDKRLGALAVELGSAHVPASGG